MLNFEYIHMFYTKKSLGQNFLINRGVLDKIVSAAELTKDDVVVEIGPGTGSLTKLLSEKAGQVIAVEKDNRLIENLRRKFKNTNVEIIEDDILKLTRLNLEFQGLTLYNFKIVGNIPYYITSHLLKTIFEKWPRPKLIILTVQKEVAQRIVAKPPDMNLLALSVQIYSDPKIIGYISHGSFRPMPKVDSAIIKLVPKTDRPENKGIFFKLVKAGFSGKRKQLKNTLAKFFDSKEKAMEILNKLNIKPESRPEELTLEIWLKLAALLSTA